MKAIDTARIGELSALLASLAANESSARHPYRLGPALRDGPAAARNLADAVHHLAQLHIRAPALFDLARNRDFLTPEATPWLVAAAQGHAVERAWLARLVAAAGPPPPTPAQSQSETAIRSQRHAFDTLGRSERAGCVLGAALALALEWEATRDTLLLAGRRFDIGAPPFALPDRDATLATATLYDGHAVERAIGFGARQLFAQQRALWDLLAARARARSD